MKKMNMLYLLLFFIIQTSPMHQASELHQLSQLLVDQGLAAEQWEVTIKEQLPTKQANEILQRFNESYSEQVIENNQTVKYIYKENEQVEDVAVSFIITIPRQKQYSAEIVAKMEGTTIDNLVIAKFEEQYKNIMEVFFTKKAKAFTCLMTTTNDTITSDVFFRETSKRLDLKYISTQSEKIKDTLTNDTTYGYTTHLENKMMLHDEPLNIQMVVQSNENKTQKIIIGTPILITEY